MYASVELMFVDDNPGDIRLYQEFFKANKFRNNVRYTQSYADMLNQLHQGNLPDVILMSMHMLMQTDAKALSELKSEPRFQQIPLVGLTSSPEEQNIAQSMGACITHFMLKPLNVNNLYTLLAKVENLGLVISWDNDDRGEVATTAPDLNLSD